MSETPEQTASNSFIDDPFFVDPSDTPRLVLVSQPLTCDNYPVWSWSMTTALTAKNKLGFVDGSIPKPDESDPNRLNSWIRNDSMVSSWIINSVSNNIATSIKFNDSAAKMWTDLRNWFQKRIGPRIFQIKRDMVNLSQNQDTVSVYFTKLKSMWDALSGYKLHCLCGKCLCGGVPEMNCYFQMEYAMNFLMGLNDSFAQIRRRILLMDPLPPIDRIVSLVVNEEQRMIKMRRVRVICTHCNRLGHTTENCYNIHGFPHVIKMRRVRVFCTHCNRLGHTVENCYDIHGFPHPDMVNQKVNNLVAGSQDQSN